MRGPFALAKQVYRRFRPIELHIDRTELLKFADQLFDKSVIIAKGGNFAPMIENQAGKPIFYTVTIDGQPEVREIPPGFVAKVKSDGDVYVLQDTVTKESTLRQYAEMSAVEYARGAVVASGRKVTADDAAVQKAIANINAATNAHYGTTDVRYVRGEEDRDGDFSYAPEKSRVHPIRIPEGVIVRLGGLEADGELKAWGGPPQKGSADFAAVLQLSEDGRSVVVNSLNVKGNKGGTLHQFMYTKQYSVKTDGDPVDESIVNGFRLADVRLLKLAAAATAKRVKEIKLANLRPSGSSPASNAGSASRLEKR